MNTSHAIPGACALHYGKHALITIMKQSNSTLTDSIVPQSKPDKAPNGSFMVNTPVPVVPLLPFFTVEGDHAQRLSPCSNVVFEDPSGDAACLITLQGDSGFTYFPSLPYPLGFAQPRHLAHRPLVGCTPWVGFGCSHDRKAISVSF